MAASLRTLKPGQEKLGLPTIMDRALASKFGISYVHLSVFCIDIDRVREAFEDEEREMPFAWEVFLTYRYISKLWLGNAEAELALKGQLILPLVECLEETVVHVLELNTDEGSFGSQLPFAVWYACEKKALPKRVAKVFAPWKKKPVDLARELDVLEEDALSHEAELARLCLDAELDPPLAPPTRDALRALGAEIESSTDADR